MNRIHDPGDSAGITLPLTSRSVDADVMSLRPSMLFKNRIPVLILSTVCSFFWPFVFRYDPALAIVGGSLLVLATIVGRYFLVLKSGRPDEKRGFRFSLWSLVGLTACVAIGMTGVPLLTSISFLVLVSKEVPADWSTILVVAGGLCGASAYLYKKSETESQHNRSWELQ